MSSRFFKLAVLVAAIVLWPILAYGQGSHGTLIQSAVEPLPNCTPATQGQLQPEIWDITAGELKTCGPGANQWTAVGATTPGLFASFQFGTNPAIVSGANYFQLVAGSNVTFNYSGSGTLASPFIATINATNTSSVAFSALTPGSNTSLGGFIFATTSTTTVPLTILSPASMTADVFDVCSNNAGACGTNYFSIASTGTAAFAAVPNLPSQSQKLFFASPNGASGIPSFRAIVASDVPTLNQNTTGTSGGLTGSPAITVSSIIDSGLTAGTSPVCPNGVGGAFTTSGCSGGGGTPASPAFSIQYNNAGAFGAITPPSDTQQYTLTGSTGQVPVWALPGIVPSACNINFGYTVLSSDRGKILCQSGTNAGTWTLAQAGSAGFNGNWYVTVINDSTQNLTINATTSTFTSLYASGSSLTIPKATVCYIQSDNTNYFAQPCLPLTLTPGAGITFTYGTFGININASIPDFKVNGTDLNAPQNPINFVNSTATNGLTLTFSNPSLANIQLGFTGTLNDSGLTDPYSGAGSCSANQYETADNRDAVPTCDFVHNLYDSNGLSTIISSATASAVDQLTVKNAATGNPAVLTVSATGTDTNISINLVSKGTGTIQCNGVSCGGGSGPSIQTNGVANTSQTVLNFITSTTNSAGLTITPSNPATGNEKFEITGTINAANVANIPLNQVISPTAQPAAYTMTGDTLTFNWGSTNTNQFAFDSNGNPTFGLVSFTTAVTNSPTLCLGGSYENAATPTFAEESACLQLQVAAGLNGNVTLALTDSGSTGTLTVALPSSTILTANTFTANSTTGGFTWNGPSSSKVNINASGAIGLTSASGQNVSFNPGNNGNVSTLLSGTGSFQITGSGTASDILAVLKYGNASPTGDALDFQNSSSVVQASFSSKYIFTKMGSTSLTGDGTNNELGTSNLTGQTGSIGSTTLFTTNAAAPYGASVYDVQYYVDCTTGQSGATITLTVTWNDGASQTDTPVNAQSCTTTNTVYRGVEHIYSAVSQAIAYSTTASGFTTGAYAVHISVVNR